MKRRNFLKMFIKTFPIIFIPTILNKEIVTEIPEYTNVVTYGYKNDWICDEETKTIIYQGGYTDNNITAQQLYNFLKDDWNSEEGIYKNNDFTFLKREFGTAYGEFKEMKI